ncbi:MAG: hypothetical protein JSV99_07550 [Planctomycetota bacterium]|nr:MAG: hypothetical protein JSV99_07550 [Planctomycetota bacterium]
MNVLIEQKGVSGNDLHDIIKAIPTGEPKAEEPADKPAKKLRIDNLEIEKFLIVQGNFGKFIDVERGNYVL